MSENQIAADIAEAPSGEGLPDAITYTAEDEARDRARLVALHEFSGIELYERHKDKVDAFIASFTADEFPSAIVAINYALYVKAVRSNDPVAQTILGSASVTTVEALNEMMMETIKQKAMAAIKSGQVDVGSEGFGGIGIGIDSGTADGIPVTEDELLAVFTSEHGRITPPSGDLHVNGLAADGGTTL